MKAAMLVLMGLIVIGLSIYMIGWVGPDEENKTGPVVIYDDFDDNSSVENVIDETIVIKKVYVKEEDFSSYGDSEVGASYWYVQYYCKNKTDGKEWNGYDIYELSTPYFDLKNIRKQIWSDCGDNDYIQINTFQRVPFETYKAYTE